MKIISILLYEFKHFLGNKSKFFAFLFFLMICFYSILNGFNLYKSNNLTISNIINNYNDDVTKIQSWFDNETYSPPEKPWINVSSPFWAINQTPQYVIKKPSKLLPISIGQSEQFGFYKKLTNWSSTYDNDMVEEIANPERLINGNIDFSYLVMFLSPLLMIILVYNIGGLEKDLLFNKLISTQFGSYKKWILIRFTFYFLLIFISILFFIIISSVMTGAIHDSFSKVLLLIFLSALYVFLYSLFFYLIQVYSPSSSSSSFKMISFWLLFCIVIPGSVHLFVSIKHPVNYMTEFLDANRKDAYAIFELDTEDLYYQLVDLYPDLSQTIHGNENEIDSEIIANSVSALVNELNKKAIAKIDNENNLKNKLIASFNWFNPVIFFQNKWNSITSSDYNSYYQYRMLVQEKIDKRLRFLVFELWNRKVLSKDDYKIYLRELQT